MAVTEQSLLSRFLLTPAPLAASLSLQDFTELFPKSRRTDPAISSLYRELQRQHAQDVERVKENITAEVKVGESQQRQIRRIRQARLRQEHGDDAIDLNMEAELFPESSIQQHREAHNPTSLLSEIAQANIDAQEEISNLEDEAHAILEDLKATVGDLSDLKYGRFSKTPGSKDGDIGTDVLEGLRRIQQLCADAGV